MTHRSGPNGITGARRAHKTIGGRWLALLPASALLALLLAACGSSSPTATLATDQTFSWPLQQEATTADEVFDPAEIQTLYDDSSAQMIYSGLVTLGNDLTVQNDMAKKIDVSDGGKTYTFHLLPGLKFSDGQPLTAADYAWSIDRALDPHLCDGTDANGNAAHYGNSPYGDNCNYSGATYLNHILGATDRINGNGGGDQSVVATGDNPAKGISVIDDQTLVIRLDAPVAYFLEALTYPTAYPLEKALVQKYPNGDWVNHLNEGGCSGPFKVGSYGDGKTVTYVPNPYWADAHGKKLTLTRVVRPYAPSVDQEYTDYRSGKFDYTDVPGRDYEFARGQEDFHEVAGLVIQYFGFNFQTPPFDSKEVRQAFDLALNRQLMVNDILKGGAIPTNHIVPQNMPGFFAGLTNPAPDRTQSLTGNQDAAVSLLKVAQSQCKGPPKSFQKPTDPDFCPFIDAAHYPNLQEIDVWAGLNNQTRVDLTTAAVQQWAKWLSLNVQLKTAKSFGALLPHIKSGAYGAWAIGWAADYADPQDFISLQFASDSDANYSHVNDPNLDALMKQADQEQSPTKRLDLYHQAEQQIVDLVPWAPYEQQKITWRLQTWVHGFSLNSFSTISDLQWPSVFITNH
jgi:peptide/nickel transport system substrate-binding protein/oligopeptide transport system substrate-binding protein